jgi:hypoxanthine phosphoribosyltransferase
VGDSHAVKRLRIPTRLLRGERKTGVREIGWAAFGELTRRLALRMAERFRPDAVVGLAKGGVFVGSAMAATLGVDFHPVRIEKRARDPQGPSRIVASREFPKLQGKRVLIADDVVATGQTLAKARRLAQKAGAIEVQAAVLVVRPSGSRPEWYALETDELCVFGWDYQLDPPAGVTGGDPGDTGV